MSAIGLLRGGKGLKGINYFFFLKETAVNLKLKRGKVKMLNSCAKININSKYLICAQL